MLWSFLRHRLHYGKTVSIASNSLNASQFLETSSASHENDANHIELTKCVAVLSDIDCIAGKRCRSNRNHRMLCSSLGLDCIAGKRCRSHRTHRMLCSSLGHRLHYGKTVSITSNSLDASQFLRTCSAQEENDAEYIQIMKLFECRKSRPINEIFLRKV